MSPYHIEAGIAVVHAGDGLVVAGQGWGLTPFTQAAGHPQWGITAGFTWVFKAFTVPPTP